MITNLNVRVLGNDAIMVQYQQGGKAKDAGFSNWFDFLKWLQQELDTQGSVIATGDPLWPID